MLAMANVFSELWKGGKWLLALMGLVVLSMANAQDAAQEQAKFQLI